jgi:CheY-like chemotaxis protein
MPEMGGIEATEKIRAEVPPEFQPAIIALTADVFAETRQRCLAAGMNEVLTKPIQRSKLIHMLRQFLPTTTTIPL